MDMLLWVHSLLRTYGLTPNKALGQNFLVDEARLSAIAEAALVAEETVLEVGPGLGALTQALLGAGAKRVIAVEKDARLAQILRVELDDLRLRVLTEDFLDTDIAKAVGNGPFTVCANLPYYITTPAAERLLCAMPRRVTLMVQKEAAQRFFAPPSTRVYGPLTVLANTFYRPEHILDVPRTSFYPQPEVDSAVVRLTAVPAPEGADPTTFLMLLKQLFAKRRKMIKNNFPDDMALSLCGEAGISPGERAEAIPPEALLRLYLAAEKRSGTQPPELIKL